MRNGKKLVAAGIALAVALALFGFSGAADARDDVAGASGTAATSRDAGDEPAPSPTFEAPAAFAWAPAAGSALAPEVAFWRGFGDARLSALVDEALAANTDLRVATARYHSANALLRGARLELLPVVTAGASAADSRLAADEAPGVARGDRDGQAYSVGATLSWELDLFGRVRHGVDARRAETAAVAADLQALQLLIVADVSRAYFTLRGLQERLRVAQENVASQTETLRLVQAGLDAGRGTDFDISRARAQLASTRARVPALEAQVATTMHRLAVLTGRPPAALRGELAPSTGLPALPPPVDPGTPGDLLARRPDVAAAQARLAAATARVGVAKADLFPRFTLGGLFGSFAADTGGLFHRDGEQRLVALGIDWSFLDVGRVRARLASARADADAEVAAYEGVLLRALQETEDALVRLDRARIEDAELAAAAADGATAARLARIRYEAGAADLFEVLDAERVLLQAQDASAAARTRTFENLVDVYRAVAGGWPAPAVTEIAAR